MLRGDPDITLLKHIWLWLLSFFPPFFFFLNFDAFKNNFYWHMGDL